MNQPENHGRSAAQAALRRLALLLLAAASGPALADYGKTPNSTVDSAITRIDEKQFLGAPVGRGFALQDSNGKEFVLGDVLDKPLILVLSYYSCDGACPAINESLRIALDGVSRWRLGQDYRVLTLSFDRHDTQENMDMFVQHAGFGNGLPAGWTVARFKNPDDIARFTASIGFKYFWDPRDRVFLHPAVYTIVSPEARITRFLYAGSVQASDVALSITDAYGNEVARSNLINYLVGACYSYNYRDGKYTLSYPLFIAVGTLGFGMSLLAVGSAIMKRRGKNENE